LLFSWLIGKKPWVFTAKTTRCGVEAVYELLHPHRVAIIRHAKIRAKANPYDPAWRPYLNDRKRALARQRLCVV
jgi:RNA-directed DNA polymerase